MGWQEIVSRALVRDIRAVSRLISIVEDRRSGFEDAYAAIYPHTGKAHVIGITGPPGSGKSTLVDKIAAEYAGGQDSWDRGSRPHLSVYRRRAPRR